MLLESGLEPRVLQRPFPAKMW